MEACALRQSGPEGVHSKKLSVCKYEVRVLWSISHATPPLHTQRHSPKIRLILRYPRVPEIKRVAGEFPWICREGCCMTYAPYSYLLLLSYMNVSSINLFIVSLSLTHGYTCNHSNFQVPADVNQSLPHPRTFICSITAASYCTSKA